MPPARNADDEPDPPLPTPSEIYTRELLERVGAGQHVTIDAVVERYPQFERELREIHSDQRDVLGTFRALGLDDEGHGESRRQLEQDDATRERRRFARRMAEGETLGDFLLVREIGHGGMGQVWQALQQSRQRTVALKLIRPDVITDLQRERFAREARASIRLRHPNVVTVYDFGRDEELDWIAMEYVPEGRTLRDYIDEMALVASVPAGRYREVALLVAGIADGLQAAHDAGVIHRDLKPQNVLLEAGLHPKVTDFGLAKVVQEESLTGSDQRAGTLWYMSPEQVSGAKSEVDARSDIFGLGVILYELLALRRPFDGGSPHEVTRKIEQVEPDGLRTVRAGIPRDLAIITAKCLEKSRVRRYGSMTELAADLCRFARNEPILAQPPGPIMRLTLWARRNPVVSIAGTLAAVALVVISVLLGLKIRDRRELSKVNSQLLARNSELATANSERTRMLADLGRLSALQTYQLLVAKAGVLWPIQPEMIPRYERWIAEASALVAELHAHVAKRAELDDLALPQTEEEKEAQRELHPEYQDLKILRMTIKRERDKANAAGVVPDIAHAEQECVELQRRIDLTLIKKFQPGTADLSWWHASLGTLIAELTALSDPRTGLLSAAKDAASMDHGWSVPRRLKFARTLREETLDGPEAAHRWNEVLDSLVDDPAFAGVELEPQVGLLPIGRDPSSHLWEFAHLQSGDSPQRDTNGMLQIGEGTCIVLVLIPPGTFWMGAQADDPAERNYDAMALFSESPMFEARMSAFFMAKHELSQAQYNHAAGGNPSIYQAHPLAPTSLHPVENISWSEAKRVMQWLGLELPFESQWEYAARGKTYTPWWTGSDRETLRGHVNLADLAARNAKAQWPSLAEWPDLDDGSPLHAEIHHFSPNSFGLVNVIGNVEEWVLDSYADYLAGSFMNPSVRPVGGGFRVARGGSFADAPSEARSSSRNKEGGPDFRSPRVGLRASRGLAQ